MRKLLAGVSLLAMGHAASAQSIPQIVVPQTGATPLPTPAGQQQLISGTSWINGRGLLQGPNWRDNYQIIHDIFNTMGTWNAQGVYTPTIAGKPFAPSATIDTTNASNITSGLLTEAQIPHTFANPLTLNGTVNAYGGFNLYAPAGASRAITGYAGSNARWNMQPGNADAETGNNTGTNWALYAFKDDGSFNGNALLFNRATLAATFGGVLNGNGSGLTSLNASNVNSGLLPTAQAPWALQRTGDTATGILCSTSGGNCDTGAWNAFIGGTASANPTYDITALSTAINLPFASVSGVNTVNGAVGDRTYLQRAQFYVSGRTKLDGNTQENMISWNFISQTGAGAHDTSHGDHSEKVGEYGNCIVVAGAANSWCQNLDMTWLASNTDQQNLYMYEDDLTNFRHDFQPNGLGSGVGRFRTFTGFPILAAESWGGATPYGGGNPAGTVTADVVAGQNYVTLDSGSVNVGDQLSGAGIPAYTYVLSTGTPPTFPATPAMATTNISAAGTKVYIGNNAGNLVTATATQAAEALTQNTFNMHAGFQFNGSNLVRDSLLVDGTNANTTLKVFGTHDRVIDTSISTTNYVLVANSGQKLCLNGLGGCMYGDTSVIPVKFNTPVGVVGVDSPATGIGFDINSVGSKYPAMIHYSDAINYNWGVGLDSDGSFSWYNGRFPTSPGVKAMTLSNAGNLTIGQGNSNYITFSGNSASFGPTIQAVGVAGANVPLTLQSQGLSPVQINGGLSVGGTMVATNAAFGTYTTGAASPTGYIAITDASGVTRHLAVVP